jgi:importin subunit beta-1
LAALNALYNSLEFIRENFSREAERSYIMMVVCEATQSVDSRVQVSAFECLVRIMTFYYGFMGVYMEKALYALTVNGMKHDNENVALQAIEFWSTVCELENDYEYESQMAEEEGADVEQQPLGFAKAALSEIVPVLLTLMTSQEEDVDEDEWNVAMAAATCLSLLAQCVQDNIVALVLPFVQTNIRNPDWRYREAAVMAFGSIMEGPNPQLLAPLATQAMPILLEMIRDPVVQVKDTTAWTLGQISENLLAYINLEAQLQSLVTALLAGLSDSPKITSNCCWALMNIGRGLNPDEQHDLATYPLSPFFEGICKELVTICNKDNNEANSRTSAFEALATIIAHCPLDVLQIVSAIAISMLERLELTINVQNQIVGMDEMNQHLELQSNICNAITSITRRLGRSIAPVADRIMQVFLQLMSVSGRHATTLEDAFLAIGAVIAALETDFFRYMEAFKNFLYAALQNHEEHQLCLIAIGLIGDICRSLGLQALPYCDEFFTLLLADLSSEKLHRSVKPAIFECFGDIVLAIGGSFEKYAPTVLPIIFSACQIQVNDAMSADELDYLVSLREGIVEGFVGIVQGLKTDAKVGMLEPYLPQLFQFLEFAIADEDIVSTDLLMNEAGLLGDLAEAFPNGQLRTLLQRDWIVNLLRSARTNRHATVSQREVSRWAREMVKRAMK